MSVADIDRAFVQAFINGSFGLPIAHENAPYVPKAQEAYAELLVLTNDVTPFSLNGSNETDGVFRVLLRYPTDIGAMAAKIKADEILAAFSIGKRVCYGTQCATVVSQQRQQGVPEEGWFKINVSFRYRAFIER